MSRIKHHLIFFFGIVICLGACTPLAAKTVKVFILVGQSNMQGHGAIDSSNNEGKGSLSHLAENDEKFAHLKKGKSGWVERDDVMIAYLDRKGALAPGFGANGSKIGPELGFGHVVGEAISEPVLLVKTAWGGKSLDVDFRPPSAGGAGGTVLYGDGHLREKRARESQEGVSQVWK